MPALEMTQESGRLVSWLKQAGEAVSKGEPLMEIETDKVSIEIEAPAAGILAGVVAKQGDVVPVGQTIAWILAPGERAPIVSPPAGRLGPVSMPAVPERAPEATAAVKVSPVARRYAEENGVELAHILPVGKRIEKADVQAHIESSRRPATPTVAQLSRAASASVLLPASPKARRLASERGIDLAAVSGSGPGGAVLAADLPADTIAVQADTATEPMSGPWRVMAEHMSASWTTVPHFYLAREVYAGSLVQWRDDPTALIEKTRGMKVSVTDLLVKLAAVALRAHPRVNAAYEGGLIRQHREVNVGLAVAVEEGLIVPVIHGADGASIGEIAARRHDLVERAKQRKLRPADVAGGTFTISNLGMYNVDAFHAIVNAPQAAILTVGRIAERVVPLNGQPVIRPMMSISLSCDHRVVDGARAAEFLDELANLIADPLLVLSA